MPIRWSSVKYRVLLAIGKASEVLRGPDCLATHVYAHLAYLDLWSSHFHLLASPRTTSRNARRLSHTLRRPLSADLSASALNSLPQPYCPAVVLLPLCRLAAPSLHLSIRLASVRHSRSLRGQRLHLPCRCHGLVRTASASPPSMSSSINIPAARYSLSSEAAGSSSDCSYSSSPSSSSPSSSPKGKEKATALASRRPSLLSASNL